METVNLATASMDYIVRRLSDTLQSQVMRNSMAGSNLANFATQAFYGTNYNPSVHGTIGTITNLIGSSILGQTLGMDNPRVSETANRRLADYYFGAARGHYMQNIALIGNAMAKYNRYNAEINKNNLFQLTQTESSAAMYHLRNFYTQSDFAELSNARTTEEISDTKIAQVQDKVAQVITSAKKVLGMGDDIAAILNTANVIGGTSNIETNFNRFLNKTAQLVQGGLSLEERQAVIQNSMEMNMAYRRRGFGAAAASMIADASSSAYITAAKLQRSGVQIDSTDLANNIAEKSAIYLGSQTLNLQYALSAGESIQDKGQKQAYLDAIRNAGNDPSKLNAIVNRFGLGREYEQRRIRYALDSKSIVAGLSSEAQDVLKENTEAYLLRNTEESIYARLDMEGSRGTYVSNRARSIYQDIRSGKKTSLTDEEDRILKIAGISDNVYKVMTLQQKQDISESTNTIAQAIGTEGGSLVFGDKSQNFIEKLRNAGTTGMDGNYNYVTGKYEFQSLSADEAMQSFLNSQKEKQGQLYDENKAKTQWQQLMQNTSEGMSMMLNDGTALMKDKSGVFFSANKDRVERATKADFDLKDFETLGSKFVDKVLSWFGENVLKVKNDEKEPPTKATQ